MGMVRFLRHALLITALPDNATSYDSVSDLLNNF